MSNDSQLLQFQTFMSRLMSNNNQSTAGNESCSDGKLLSELQTDIKRLTDNQQQILQTLQILQQQQLLLLQQQNTTKGPGCGRWQNFSLSAIKYNIRYDENIHVVSDTLTKPK